MSDHHVELKLDGNRVVAVGDGAAQVLPEPEGDTKLVYVKRWRTLVRLPVKYADEIVEALRASPLPSTQEKSPKSFNPLDAGFSLVDDGRICRIDDPDCRHPLCNCARYVNEQRASPLSSTDGGTGA